MARSSRKNKKNTANNKENVLLKKWSGAISLLDDYVAGIIDELFKTIKKFLDGAVYDKVAGGISVYDEKIYSAYVGLMDSYRGIVKIYEEYPLDFSEDNIKDIYTGLHDIMISRINIFEEDAYKTGSSMKLYNPVIMEKAQILEECAKDFDHRVDRLRAGFCLNYQRDIIFRFREKLYCLMDESAAKIAVDGVRSAIYDNCSHDLFELYAGTVKNTISNLNDFEKRKAVSYYYDIINQEYEILSSIIKVQAGALENYIRAGTESLKIIEAINNMLKNLRGIYQRFGKEIDRISWENRENEMTSEARCEDNEDEFIETVFYVTNRASLPSFEKIKENFAVEISDFKNMFMKEAKKVFDFTIHKANTGKDYYDVRRTFSKTASMAEAMKSVFEYISSYYSENKERILLNSENVDIVAGVAETVAIKIESFKEAGEFLNEEADQYYKKIALIKAEMAPEEIAEAVSACCDSAVTGLMKLDKDDRRGAVNIRKELDNLKNNDVIAAFYEKSKRISAQKIEGAHKKALSFIRDYLLFEIRSFEEIMMHSVSRLRAEENEDMKKFIEVIDKQSEGLNDILMRNGISLINPQPHDMFNGREHEVLLAERQEGCKKGEIIKVMNSGYRQDDIIIYRANVIAAR